MYWYTKEIGACENAEAFLSRSHKKHADEGLFVCACNNIYKIYWLQIKHMQ